MSDEPKHNSSLPAAELDEVGECKRRMKFTVPFDEVEREFAATYEHVKNTAQIQGFRPGKAPRHVVEMRMGKAFRETALSRIRERAVEQAVAEHKLRPVTAPQFENIVYEKGKPFTFEATVEVIPEITLPEYKGIKIEKKEPAPTADAEVYAELDRLRESYARLEEVKDRPLKEGDFAVASYDEEADGQTEKFDKRLIEVKEESLLPGFVEGIKGMNIGEHREFQIQTPEDYHDKEAAGKKIMYRLQLHEIRERKLPEADDAFAKRLEMESLDALRSRIHRAITERKERDAEQEEISQIMTYLLKNTDFQVPEALVSRETGSRLRRKVAAAYRSGVSQQEVRDKREEILKETAGEAYASLKLQIIFLEIAKSEGIEVSDVEVDARLEQIAASRNEDKEAVKKQYHEADLYENVRSDMLEQKVVSFLHNSAVKE
jgi:trigger factor